MCSIEGCCSTHGHSGDKQISACKLLNHIPQSQICKSPNTSTCLKAHASTPYCCSSQQEQTIVTLHSEQGEGMYLTVTASRVCTGRGAGRLTMSGDCGEVRHREGPAQALPLQVEVEQVLVSEHQSLGVLVLQVVHHVVCRVPPLVHVGKAVLPPPKVAYLPCSPNNASHLRCG